MKNLLAATLCGSFALLAVCDATTIDPPTVNADENRFDIQMFYADGLGSAEGVEGGWEYRFTVTPTGPNSSEFDGYANYLNPREDNSFFGSFTWGQWTPSHILYDTVDNYASGDSLWRLVSSISYPDGTGVFVFHASNIPIQRVPESGATALMMGLALCGFAALRKRLG